MAAKKKANGAKRAMPKANPKNMEVEIDGSDLVIRISMKTKPWLSSSGKAKLLATSGGWWMPEGKGLPKGLVVNGNIMLPK